MKTWQTERDKNRDKTERYTEKHNRPKDTNIQIRLIDKVRKPTDRKRLTKWKLDGQKETKHRDKTDRFGEKTNWQKETKHRDKSMRYTEKPNRQKDKKM